MDAKILESFPILTRDLKKAGRRQEEFNSLVEKHGNDIREVKQELARIKTTMPESTSEHTEPSLSPQPSSPNPSDAKT